MRRPEYAEPFEDEALEARAWEHYHLAREQGSHLTEGELIRHCRDIAHKEIEQLERAGEEPVLTGADDE